MRVILITQSYPTKSNPAKGIFIKEEASALSTSIDLSVRVISTWFSKWRHLFNNDKFISEPNVSVTSISYPSLPIKRAKPQKGRLIESRLRLVKSYRHADIVHAHGINSAGLIAPFTKKKIIITVHGSDWNLMKGKPLWEPVLRQSLESASHIITVSDHLKQDIASVYPHLLSKISVVHHGIDNWWFSDPTIDLPKRDDHHLNLICVAGLHPVKGVIYLIEALKSISLPYSSINLTIISGGEDKQYKEKVLRSIDDLPKQITVTLLSKQPKEVIKKYLLQSDFAILPSVHEGFGIFALEAMACGIPVLATASGGPEETILSRKTGLIVEPENSNALCFGIEKMESMLSEFDADFIKKHILDNFSRHTSISKIASIYEQTKN